MNELIDYDCVDLKKLLIIKSKDLGMSDEECYLLLIMLTMQDIRFLPIHPQNISKMCSMSFSKIDETMMSLLDKKWIKRDGGSLDFTPLKKLLIGETLPKQEKEINVLGMFEDAFGRLMSSQEMEIIKSFKIAGYDDKMIVDALNEAVKSNVINFRYIEKILENWRQYGVKRKYAPQKKTSASQNIDNEVKEYEWWNNG